MYSHFNFEDGRQKQHFWRIMPYYFKKGKNVTETQNRVVQYMEKVLRLIKLYTEDFSLDGAHGSVDQLILIPGVKIVLIFEMLLGRLELYPILLLFFQATWRAK